MVDLFGAFLVGFLLALTFASFHQTRPQGGFNKNHHKEVKK
jgi:hypothetical protein